MTKGSSILAMMRTSRPHLSQVSFSILKTRFNRFAQVIEILFSAGVWSGLSGDWTFPHLPRLAGVTRTRYLLLGAKTPWKRVRLTLGLGTRETSLDMTCMDALMPREHGCAGTVKTSSSCKNPHKFLLEPAGLNMIYCEKTDQKNHPALSNRIIPSFFVLVANVLSASPFTLLLLRSNIIYRHQSNWVIRTE